MPATFTIKPGGKLEPSTISAPAFLAVQISVVSADGKPHHVLVKTPVPHTLSVPAGGRTTVLVPGMRVGAYVVDVDGVARGTLTIGGEPGP